MQEPVGPLGPADAAGMAAACPASSSPPAPPFPEDGDVAEAATAVGLNLVRPTSGVLESHSDTSVPSLPSGTAIVFSSRASNLQKEWLSTLAPATLSPPLLAVSGSHAPSIPSFVCVSHRPSHTSMTHRTGSVEPEGEKVATGRLVSRLHTRTVPDWSAARRDELERPEKQTECTIASCPGTTTTEIPRASVGELSIRFKSVCIHACASALDRVTFTVGPRQL